MVDSNPAFSYHTGAVRWVAPELITPPEDTVPCATKSSDIYSLGCIMLQVSLISTLFVDTDMVSTGAIRDTSLFVDQDCRESHGIKVQ